MANGSSHAPLNQYWCSVDEALKEAGHPTAHYGEVIGYWDRGHLSEDAVDFILADREDWGGIDRKPLLTDEEVS